MTVVEPVSAGTFVRDGFTVLPHLVEPSAVPGLRTTWNAALARRSMAFGSGVVMPIAALAAPEALDIATDTRLLSTVRGVLGTEEVMLTLEAGIHRNVVGGVWHTDCGEKVRPQGYFGTDDPWADPECRVVRVGLYLQDHFDGSGLTVRPGSNASPDVTGVEEVSLRHAAGDAVIIDVRLSHRGTDPSRRDHVVMQALRGTPKAGRGYRVEATRSRLRTMHGRRDRLAMFFTYGVPNERTHVYAHRVLERQMDQLGGAVPPLARSLASRLEAAGVLVPEGFARA